MNLRVALWGLFALVLAGCRQTTSLTEVRADGSFDRKLTLMASTTSADEDPELSIRKGFRLPTDPTWKVTISVPPDSNSGPQAVLSRSFKPNESSQDIVLLDSMGAPMLRNRVSVISLGNGLWEYRETFTHEGKPRARRGDAIVLPRIREAIGANAKATEAQMSEMARAVETIITDAMVGPPEPLLSMMAVSPEFVIRKLRAITGPKLLQVAERIFADALTPDQRRSLVSAILSQDTIQGRVQSESGTPDPTQEITPSEPSSLTAVVKMPGGPFETNGLVDPLTGEIYWTFFDMAAEDAPVELFVRMKE